jgi:hypothetical protein
MKRTRRRRRRNGRPLEMSTPLIGSLVIGGLVLGYLVMTGSISAGRALTS